MNIVSPRLNVRFTITRPSSTVINLCRIFDRAGDRFVSHPWRVADPTRLVIRIVETKKATKANFVA